MPAPVKWSIADFELNNAENPEGEPWLAASPDGRFTLSFYESFGGVTPYTDIEARIYDADGAATTTLAPTFSSTTIDHQPASAYMPDGRQVFVWSEEPAAGGGNLEDVYASIYVGGLVSLPRFLVSGGAARQHDPVVAASASGFAVALADSSVAGGQLILKFYNAVGGLLATVNNADASQGVNLANPDLYRDVEITALANGNYVVSWTDGSPTYDIYARVFGSNGVAITGIIDIKSAGPFSAFPDVTALADGRFLVTYDQYIGGTVRGRIYEADGAPSTDPFTIIAFGAENSTNQQVQSAALQDGRFVTVWLSLGGNIAGQVMKADGTPDGAVFAVNSDAAGDKGRPTIATLADGRFVVSWESGAGAAQTIFSTIFDPRETGLNGAASGLDDDWRGTSFSDTIYGAAGNDKLAGAGGVDYIYGEAGQDTLNGDAGVDRLFGGAHNDTLNGGVDGDLLYGGLGGDTIIGGDGNDIWLGGDAGNDVITGNLGTDRLSGGADNDTLTGGEGFDYMTGEAGVDTFVYNAVADGTISEQIGDWQGGIDKLQIDASAFGGGLAAGALAANRLVIGTVANQAFGQFLYNAGNGVLYWDADGTGAGAAVAFTRLFTSAFALPPASLAAADFVLVA